MAKKNLEQFYKLVDDIEIAMFTTRADGADLWFVTDKSSPKMDLGLGHRASGHRSREDPRALPTGLARVVRR